MMHIAMLHHASNKIGEDFARLSQHLTGKVDSKVSPWITTFNSTPASLKTLEAFGITEVVRGGKFEFKGA